MLASPIASPIAKPFPRYQQCGSLLACKQHKNPVHNNTKTHQLFNQATQNVYQIIALSQFEGNTELSKTVISAGKKKRSKSTL